MPRRSSSLGELLNLVFLPHQTMLSLDAIVRSLDSDPVNAAMVEASALDVLVAFSEA